MTIISLIKVLIALGIMGTWKGVDAQADCIHPTVAHAGISKRISGGETLGVGEWPFLVKVQVDVSGPDEFCAGALIHPQYVLTALSCAGEFWESRHPGSWLVVVGEHNLDENDGHEVELNVKAVIHPHIPSTPQLSKPVAISNRVKPICLPERNMADPATGTPCMVGGWGFESISSPDLSVVPRRALVHVVAPEECEAHYGASPRDRICAGSDHKSGRGPCFGDGGAPLICKNETGTWNFVGLASLATGCGKDGVPAAYTKVSSHVHWIKDTVPTA